MERPQSVEGDRQEPSGSPEIAPEVPESPTSQQPGEGGTDPERTMPAQERHRGTVKWFNSSKGRFRGPGGRIKTGSCAKDLYPCRSEPDPHAGFGFITLDGSEEEIFVHQVGVPILTLMRGDGGGQRGRAWRVPVGCPDRAGVPRESGAQ